MTRPVATTIAFLHARLNEEEQEALQAADSAPGRWGLFGMTLLSSPDDSGQVETADRIATFHTTDDEGRPRTFVADFVVHHQPSFVLAQVAGKRRALEAATRLLGTDENSNEEAWLALSTIAALASIYSWHPDYQPL